MTQNAGEQGQRPANVQPSEVQDQVGGPDSMPVIGSNTGEVARRPDASASARVTSQGSGAGAPHTIRVFGDLHRKGRFRLEDQLSATLVFADMVIDLREAELPAHSDITVYTLFGDVKLIVPPGTSVTTSGMTIFGDDKIDDLAATAAGPSLRVHCVGAFADVKVKTAEPGEKISRRWRIF